MWEILTRPVVVMSNCLLPFITTDEETIGLVLLTLSGDSHLTHLITGASTGRPWSKWMGRQIRALGGYFKLHIH